MPVVRADDCTSGLHGSWGVVPASAALPELPPLPAPVSACLSFLAAVRVSDTCFSSGDSGENRPTAVRAETWQPPRCVRAGGRRDQQMTRRGRVIATGPSPPPRLGVDRTVNPSGAGPGRRASPGGARCSNGRRRPPNAALSPGGRFKGCGLGYFWSTGNNDGGQASRVWPAVQRRPRAGRHRRVQCSSVSSAQLSRGHSWQRSRVRGALPKIPPR